MIYNLEQDITCGGVRLYKERIISVLRTALPVHVEMFKFCLCSDRRGLLVGNTVTNPERNRNSASS